MANFFEEKRGILQILFAIILLVWSFAVIPYGYYVDENGLLTIYKGIYQGQRMFVDSWESLQTGGILAYPLLALYYQVLQPLFADAGINVGLVLYMRYAYTFIRLLVAIYVYITLRLSDYEDGAFSAAAFYFMFVVGWKDFSYKSYCDIAMMLIVCFVFRFYENRKTLYAVLMGVAVCVSVLAYPTMIIMAVFLGGYWLYMAIKDEASRLTVVAYVATCLVIGLIVAGYLQLTVGWGDIIAQLPNLGDQDYDNPIYIRLGKMLLSYLAFAAIAYFPIVLLKIWERFRGVWDGTERAFLTLYFLAFMVAMFVIKAEGISTSRFIYGLLIIFFWFPYFTREREEINYTRIGSYRNTGSEQQKVLWTVFIFSIVAQFVWAISTNQEVTVPGHMTLYVVMAMILLFSREDIRFKGMVTLLMLLAMFFNGLWVADSNGGFKSVFTPMYYVDEGELKGVALPEDEYNTNGAVLALLSKVEPESKLLVAFGANSAGYLNSEAWQGTYSVYARTQVNTKLMDYYKLNPDNMADYMLLDKSHDKYQYFVENETGKYLLDIYTKQVANQGDIVLLAK